MVNDLEAIAHEVVAALNACGSNSTVIEAIHHAHELTSGFVKLQRQHQKLRDLCYFATLNACGRSLTTREEEESEYVRAARSIELDPKPILDT